MSDGRSWRGVEAIVREVIAGKRSFEEGLDAVVGYQLRQVAPLASWWRGRGFDGRWTTPDDVPAVPTDVFRHVRLVSDEAPPVGVFRTSGTTSGARGEHWMLSREAYREGACDHFRRMVLPDRERIRFVSLVFDPVEVSDSSLSWMVDVLDGRFGTERSAWHLRESGVDVAGAWGALTEATEPVLVFGTAFALVQLLDGAPTRVALPAGSRVVETGGFKGRSRVVERAELCASLADRLGVPLHAIVSEYSMTELSSQSWSDGWLRGSAVDERLVWPSWTRVSVVDPETLRPLPVGAEGLVRIVDLANVTSVVAIQTSDMGKVDERGLVLYGRLASATPRGCSLAVEEITARVESARRSGER